MKRSGSVKVIKLLKEEDARWAARARPVFEEYTKKMKSKGLPGAKVLKFAREYIKANSK